MFNYIYFEELDSTNSYAKKNIDSLNNYDVIIANNQTSGRGRLSRKWHADNKSLTFSIVIKDTRIINDFASLSLLSAVAIYNTLIKYVPNVSLKWPNDVIVNNKKISGILMEAVSFNELSSLILGIGINVNNDFFPKGLDATSLYIELGHSINKDLILNDFLFNFDYLINENIKGNKIYLKTFRNNNYLLNKKVEANINNKMQTVIVKDILDDNRIVVSIGKKDYALSTGELSFHKDK